MNVIVLLTDFGESEYVGVMKGVILSIAPNEQIVDLTHEIPPQSVREGAWVLLKAFEYFPKNATFLCVVDPGVGSNRDAVFVKTKNYAFIGPDNGLMYPACEKDGISKVTSIVVGEGSSRTFHGRDVFAKAAAYIALKQNNRVLGESKSSPIEPLNFKQAGRMGEIVRIDRFGNIITNIPPLETTKYQLVVDDDRWDIELFPTYALGPDQGPFLVTSSYGTLEITIKNGSAKREIVLEVGAIISLEKDE